MKLDPRIRSKEDILTPFDTDKAKQFIGKECYFSSCESDFQKLNLFRNPPSVDWYRYCKSRLIAVSEETNSDIYCFITPPVSDANHNSNFKFCLPCEWVNSEEPKIKWRAFKDHAEYKEFLNDGIIESWVKIKDKGDNKIYELMYIGGGDDKICLGGMMFSVSNLFKDFELLNESTGEWQPFGVEGEEEKGDGL